MQTPAIAEIEKWLRMRIRFSTNFDSGSESERKRPNPAGVDFGAIATSAV